MKLSISDMRAVLKERTQSMVGRKASDDPEVIIAGINDQRTILDEMEAYANNLIETKKELEENAKDQK